MEFAATIFQMTFKPTKSANKMVTLRIGTAAIDTVAVSILVFCAAVDLDDVYHKAIDPFNLLFVDLYVA